MAVPQGLVEFPGIDAVTAAQLSLTTGITPSICNITTLPQEEFSATSGDLKFTFAGKEVVLKDCTVQEATLQIDRGQVWNVQIADRRWRWQFGDVSGLYNTRNDDGKIKKDTEKDPQSLAKLLLRAMGEAKFDVTAMPNSARPEIAWQGAIPAEELASLCDLLGCRVVLRLDNSVKIVRLGDGENLPENGDVQNISFGINRNLKPDSLKFIGGPTVYQAGLQLEAVGLDTDDEYKPLDKLSYKPDGGWEQEQPGYFSNIEDDESRRLAIETVYRTYRILNKSGIAGEFDADGRFKGVTTKFKIPGISKLLESYDQILPLRDKLLQTTATGQALPAFVIGDWHTGTLKAINATDARWHGGFTIDTESGMVTFEDSIYRVKDSPSRVLPADIKLVTTFNIRFTKDGDYHRDTLTRQLPGEKSGTKPLVVFRPDVFKTVDTYTGGKTKTNQAEFAKGAGHYLDSAEKEYEEITAATVQYAGILPIDLDGAVRQVTYVVGGRGAFTRASRNTEHDAYTPSYPERRRVERQAAEARDRGKLRRRARVK